MMLWANLPVLDTVYSKSNTFLMGVEINATDDSNVNGSAVQVQPGIELEESHLHDHWFLFPVLLTAT